VSLVLLLVSGLSSSCGLGYKGPLVPEKHAARYPASGFVTAFGCSGESVEQLRSQAKNALDEKIRTALQRGVKRTEQVVASLGLPDRFARWSQPVAGVRSLNLEHLYKTDLSTEWKDEYEGSCMMAYISREQAGWIVDREYERARKRFTSNHRLAMSANENLVAFSPPFHEARTVFRELLAAYELSELFSNRKNDDWAQLESSYADLLLMAARLARENPVLVSVQGSTDARWRREVGSTLEGALSAMGVQLHAGEGPPRGCVLEVTMETTCATREGIECCVSLAGRLLSTKADEPLAECNIAPEDRCASQGSSRTRTLEQLFSVVVTEQAVSEPLHSCVSLILPFD